MNTITEPSEIIRSYRMEYQWVEELLRRELPKYDLRRDPADSQADALEQLLPKANTSRIDFISGMAVVIFIWILVEIARKAAL